MTYKKLDLNNRPLVSIITPTCNSEKTLAKCLDSLKNQTYKNIETIIVDRNSSDKTLSITRSYQVIVFQINASERCEQLNFGVKNSSGKYIYRVDSDFVVEPQVVEQAVYACERDGYDAICVHNTSDPSISFWARVRKFERDMYKGDSLNSAARFIRRDVFETIGGFDPSLVAAEDYDLHNRLLKQGYKIGGIQAQEIHLGEPHSLKDIVSKHYYYGKTLSAFTRKNSGRGAEQLSPIRIAFIRHSKEFVRNPLLAIGFCIYQFARYIAAGLGYLVSI